MLLVLLSSKKIAAARGLLPQVECRIASDPSIYLAFVAVAGGALKITKEEIYFQNASTAALFFEGQREPPPKTPNRYSDQMQF